MAYDLSAYGATVNAPPTSNSSYSDLMAQYGATTTSPTAQQSEQTSNSSFPASSTDSPVAAGLKSVGNLPSSVFNFGKGIVETVRHPINTLSSIGNSFLGGVNEFAQKTTGNPIVGGAEGTNVNQTFDALGKALKDRYGSLENLQKTATNDPFGFGTDVLSVLDAGANLAGKGELFDRAVSTIGGKVVSPIKNTVTKAAETAPTVGKFAVSQATGLNPETINNIVNDPQAFTKANLADTNRASLASSVKDTIDQRIADLSATGKGYEAIKASPDVVNVPGGEIGKTLDKYGLQVLDTKDLEGNLMYKIKSTSESVPLSPSDKTALQDFLNIYGKEPQLTSNAFLNTRSALSDLSRYEAGRTGNLERIARDLRSTYDQLGKSQINGLAELDQKYAPEVQQLKQIKKDYLTPNGEFKDGAINKIANLTGKGKDQILGRLEQIHPGITQRIKVLKAAEDIEAAHGQKVGAYTRSASATGAAIFTATGNYPAALASIVSAIVASPDVAVPLIRAYGIAKPTALKIAGLLKGAANDVNNFRLPGNFHPYVGSYIGSKLNQVQP